MTDESRPRDDVEIEQDKILDHDYDGIKEYDNPLPRWWVVIFWATIVFSPLYILYYHFGTGPDEHERYAADMEALYEQRQEQLMALGEVSETVLGELQSNPPMMEAAEKIFASKCVQCHGEYGQGLIGPNLTDEYWIHGGSLMDIYDVVAEGVPTKGMIAWKKQLPEADLMAVSAYVGTLRGTDPPAAKAPEGEPWEPDDGQDGTAEPQTATTTAVLGG
jgi:cytochrome c oxidase cbb3-type subunit 3